MTWRGWRAPTLMKTPLFRPVELGRSGLDLARGAEGVFARVDVLAARETFEHFGAAVTYAA